MVQDPEGLVETSWGERDSPSINTIQGQIGESPRSWVVHRAARACVDVGQKISTQWFVESARKV